MKAKVLPVIVSVALLLVTGHAGEAPKDNKPAPEDPAHEELRTLKKEMVEAINKPDFDALVAKLDKDVVVTWMDGTVSHGPAEVKTYLEQKTKGPNAVVKSFKNEPEVDDLTHLYGDTGVAYGHSKDTFVLNDGREFTITTRWTATVVKKEGKWLVAGFHSSADVFDNPVLGIAIKRTAMWAGGIGGLVGLVVGLVIMWLIKRRPA
jgi:ketosteroid isomerase-like protein